MSIDFYLNRKHGLNSFLYIKINLNFITQYFQVRKKVKNNHEKQLNARMEMHAFLSIIFRKQFFFDIEYRFNYAYGTTDMRRYLMNFLFTPFSLLGNNGVK